MSASSKMEGKDGAGFDKSLLDVGGGLSEERKMTLLRRFNAQTEELDVEEEDDAGKFTMKHTSNASL